MAQGDQSGQGEQPDIHVNIEAILINLGQVKEKVLTASVSASREYRRTKVLLLIEGATAIVKAICENGGRSYYTADLS